MRETKEYSKERRRLFSVSKITSSRLPFFFGAMQTIVFDVIDFVDAFHLGCT